MTAVGHARLLAIHVVGVHPEGPRRIVPDGLGGTARGLGHARRRLNAHPVCAQAAGSRLTWSFCESCRRKAAAPEDALGDFLCQFVPEATRPW
jgi:hypothetical protein